VIEQNVIFHALVRNTPALRRVADSLSAEHNLPVLPPRFKVHAAEE
jgi:hypothetical protein